MQKYFTLIFTSIFYSFALNAQVNEGLINETSQTRATEKIHIQFDKEMYLPGETIWFKAYVFEENLPTDRSTNFYISLYNAKGIAVQQKIYPIINASADGHFDVPDTLKANELVCRAYTSWMLNFDTSFLFTKLIKIVNPTNSDDTLNKNNLSVNLQFFAEGGDVIEGLNNSIAFKASYANGLPYNFTAKLKNQQTGEEIDSIKSIHNGMGKFNFTPQPNENYYALWTDNKGNIQRTPLPEKKKAGVALKVAVQKTNLFYNISNKWPTDTLQVLGYMYKKIIYNYKLSLPQEQNYTGVIPITNLPTGALQITVLTNTGVPLAERLCFINNHNFTSPAKINTKEIGTKKREKNTIEIEVADTIPTNMSLAITDADFDTNESSTNIFTDLLLSGDIRGYIHNPAYYFADTVGANAKEYLDLVLLTNGWRKYNWADILAAKPTPAKFAQDDFLSIYGQMSETALHKISKDETINLMIKTKDSTTNFYIVTPNDKGLLKTTGLIFYDTAKVYFSFNKDKILNKQMAFSTANYTLPQPKQINDGSNFLQKYMSSTISSGVNTIVVNKYAEANKQSKIFNTGQTLKEVIVKSGGWRNWRNNPILKMEERYASGAFRGGATAYTIDVMHDDMAEAHFDIYNYLAGKIPGLVTKNDSRIGEGKTFNIRGAGVVVFLDEHYIENSQLQNISISDIAFVKFIYPFNGEGERNVQALSIYLKKGDDLIDRRPKDSDMGVVKIAGYSMYKQFYSPNYHELKNTPVTDFRTTLLWEPYIITDKNNIKIPITFYNNDFSKRFKIVLEGVNDEGKLIHVEKIIE